MRNNGDEVDEALFARLAMKPLTAPPCWIHSMAAPNSRPCFLCLRDASPLLQQTSPSLRPYRPPHPVREHEVVNPHLPETVATVWSNVRHPSGHRPGRCQARYARIPHAKLHLQSRNMRASPRYGPAARISTDRIGLAGSSAVSRNTGP